MTCSVMVCTFNRLDLTKKMLDSLFKETNFPFRLIIVDNGSSDETIPYLKNYDWVGVVNKFFLGVDIQYNDKNMGIAIGRNQGLKIANKYNDPYLCCIDNDVEFVPNWLSDCVEFLEANPRFCIGINFEQNEFPLMNKNGKMCKYKKIGNLGTACMVFPRGLHDEIGYFTTEWGLYSCEDSNFGWRSRIVKYEMAYLPTNGIHLGEGENDQGEYREFKTAAHSDIAPRFRNSCGEYLSGKRPIYIDFDG